MSEIVGSTSLATHQAVLGSNTVKWLKRDFHRKDKIHKIFEKNRGKKIFVSRHVMYIPAYICFIITVNV